MQPLREEVVEVVKSDVVGPVANIAEKAIVPTNSVEQLVEQLLERTKKAKKNLKALKHNVSCHTPPWHLLAWPETWHDVNRSHLPPKQLHLTHDMKT